MGGNRGPSPVSAVSAAYAYWLGLKVLWGWMGRTVDPPRPRIPLAPERPVTEY